MGKVKRTALQVLSGILPDAAQDQMAARFCGDLKRELTEAVTDAFLESLLRGMQTAFALSRGYRKNIDGFQAVYVFRTRDNRVAATAVFRNSSMTLESEPRSTFDTRLTFRDAEGLCSSLLAGDQDILNTMLSNPVDVDGNLNCLYRFGYLAKELTLRLGIA
jgi:hypothetical protein